MDIAKELNRVLSTGKVSIGFKESVRGSDAKMFIISSDCPRKKEIMDRIDSLESVIEEEKIEYRSGASDPGRISGLIEDLSSLIEEILAVERENEVLFTTSSSRGLKRAGPRYTPELAVSMYSADIREVKL